MQRQTLYNLVQAHFKKDEKNFLKASREISKNLAEIGDEELSKEINKLIRNNSKVVVSKAASENMVLSETQQKFLDIIKRGYNTMLLNKVFIYGRPGTGKTLFSKYIAQKINIPINIISLSHIIDSKLGESMKLLDKIFSQKGKSVIFIDEIDSIASKRGVRNDIFEISRILNHLLQLIDSLRNEKLLIVATNMHEQIDEAFARRFDISLDFNNYSKEDILKIYKEYSYKFNLYKFNEFHDNFMKLLLSTYEHWTPGYIKRVSQFSSLWLQESESPNNQIIEIMKLIGLGKDKGKIKAQLKLKGVPVRTIKYFMG